jgi:hypothetical protein
MNFQNFSKMKCKSKTLAEEQASTSVHKIETFSSLASAGVVLRHADDKLN